MAWIESHQEIARHPKTKRLARLLGEPLVAVIGRLHCLWWWALDYADDGDVSRMEAADLADACQWDGDPDAFVEMLTQVGFLDRADGQLTIHDWDEYAGRLVQKRRANVERTQRWRAEHERATNTPVMHNERVRYDATVPDRTVPDRTVPETGDDEGSAATAAPPKPVPKKASGPDLAPLVDAFRVLGLPDPVFAAGEGKAAQDLVRHYPPETIAACWQDHASGDYGGALDKQKLSFRWLLTGSPIGNWQRWKAAPHAQNGHHKPGRGPGSRQESTTAQLIVDSRRHNIAVDSDEELADRPELLAEVKRLEASGWQR